MWDIESTATLLRAMSSTSDPRELLRLFLDQAKGLFNVQRAIVLSRDGLAFPRFRVIFSTHDGDPRPGTIAISSEYAAEGGLLADLLYAGHFRRVSPLVISDHEPSHDLLRECRALVAFPLFDHAECVGMVVLLGHSDLDCTAQELCGLAIIGSLLRRADHADSLARQLEITCRTLDTELAPAANVQRWLLPPPAPPTDSVGVASFYRTALHCGGDYYDIGPLPDGRTGLLVADVSGHGAAAAVLMAILRTVVHDDIDRFRVGSPAALLDHADQHLCTLGLPSRGAFITAFSGSLDPHTGRFTYSCAGHPPPRLRRAVDGSVASLAGAGSLPLGIIHDAPLYTEDSVELQHGDLLLVYSDGITEARSPSGEFFGVDRLDRALRDLPQHASADSAIEAITHALVAFTGPAPPSDDQTLLAVRWLPDSATSRPGRSLPPHPLRSIHHRETHP